MTRRIAVAAPAAEPFDELFAAIDKMTGADVRRFMKMLAERYGLPEQPRPIFIRPMGVVDADVFARQTARPFRMGPA